MLQESLLGKKFLKGVGIVFLKSSIANEAKKKQQEITQDSTRKSVRGTIYDITNAVIHIADLVTDLYILAQFHEKKRQKYFSWSLAILLLAQLAYCITFVRNYCYRCTFLKKVMWLILLLPFAWLLPFIFHFFSNYQSSMARYLHFFGLGVSVPYGPYVTGLRKWSLIFFFLKKIIST
ncbi:hypothetical protein RFI_29229 [Reticulomyxa filosa]|uniref:Uncharacterized protein n=1 Tax=Reticulomyxa filosa TaxID=46433 RepID=X6M1W2_RETFI|nr:hypothetical protein RFI_29229 [Reticulomyxa filosa]|eukprot:ETO08163.1 hypothetical protein RFI_29229 [Reticulomyxa filosa]